MKMLFVAFGLLAGSVLYGQDSLKSVKLEDVFIMGTRASETTPVSQTTIDRSTIQGIDLGQDAAVSLEKLSPSLISFSDAGSNYGNYNQFRLRGIDQTRINITLNGVPLNDMVDQGVFFSNFVDFSSSIQSLQIQRGVGLSANGTASYGGSISYESINLDTDESKIGFGFAGGSFGTLRLNAEAATGKSEKGVSSYARLSQITSDGYKYHSGSNAQSMFMSTGKFFDNSVLKVTAFAGKTQNDQSYLPILIDDINVDPRTNYFSTNDTDDFAQEFIQLQYATNLKNDLSWNSSLYYGGARGFFPFYDAFSNTQTRYVISNYHYGLTSQLNWNKPNYQLTTGMHAYVFNRENQTTLVPDISSPYYSDETTKNEISAFAKLEYDFNKLSVFADLQARNVDMTFTADTLQNLAGSGEATRVETFFNPRIGAVYLLSNTSNLYASFGRTGREPTRTDLLQGDFNSAISTFNFTAFTDDQVIKSEFVNDIEIGYRFSGERLQINTNVFHMSFENEISLVGGLAQNSYVALRQNVAKSTRSGLEIEARYDASSKLNFQLQAAVLNTSVDSFDTGVEVLTNVSHVFAPNLILSPTINWVAAENIVVSLDARYVGESFMELGNDPGFILPSFFVTNTNIKWEIIEGVRVGFWINNLFDEQYFTDGAPVDADFDGSPEGPGYRIQPPRNFFFTLDFNF